MSTTEHPAPLTPAICVARDLFADVVDSLAACRISILSYLPDDPAGPLSMERKDAVAVLSEINHVIESLTKGPVELFTTAVGAAVAAGLSEVADIRVDEAHRTAIRAAVQICSSRAHSLFTESRNPIAGTEATKCAHAIARIEARATLLEQRPELLEGRFNG
jgi:ubiquinone biosynthesis protein UbiJ